MLALLTETFESVCGCVSLLLLFFFSSVREMSNYSQKTLQLFLLLIPPLDIFCLVQSEKWFARDMGKNNLL